MKKQPGLPAGPVSQPQSSDKDERRLVAAAVRLLMRLPRAARWGLLVAALAGAGDLAGLDDALLGTPPAGDLSAERADAGALDAR